MVTQPIGFSTVAKSYDASGFLITGNPTASPTGTAQRGTTAPAPSAAAVQNGAGYSTTTSGWVWVAVLATFSLTVLIL